MSPTIFKILMPDGKFSDGGTLSLQYRYLLTGVEISGMEEVKRSKIGKIWKGFGQLKNHLRQYFNPKLYNPTPEELSLAKDCYKDSFVVEYELVEVKRTPVKEWWDEHYENT